MNLAADPLLFLFQIQGESQYLIVQDIFPKGLSHLVIITIGATDLGIYLLLQIVFSKDGCKISPIPRSSAM